MIFHPYPLLDAVGAPILVAGFIGLLFFEHRWALRRRVEPWLRRFVRNLMVAGPSFLILRLLLIPVVVEAATWAQARNLGLLRLTALPAGIATLVAILLLDYSMYGWHWLNHRVPFLWRFHHVHHTDLDLDVSTAFRFHFGEILFSVAARTVQVVIVGASPAAALIYEIVLEASTEFHHSNVRLPVRLERLLNALIMSPRAHGIHHSIVARETNSNYSNFLMVWDRLHGTVRLGVRQDDLVIGVLEYRDARELGLMDLWLMPFRRRRAPPPSAGSAPASRGNENPAAKSGVLLP